MTSDPMTDRHREARADVDPLAVLDEAIAQAVNLGALIRTDARIKDTPMALEVKLRELRAGAALASPADSLDEAWEAAERALPHRGDRRLSWKLRLTANGKGTYVAEFVPPFMEYEAWMQAHHEAFGDSATEALRALTAALSEEPR